MTITFAFKTRVHLNNKQRSVFNRWSGSRRFVFNYALEQCIQHREENNDKLQLSLLKVINQRFNAGKYPAGFVKKTKSLPLIGTGEHEWFRDIPSSIGQAAIKTDLKEGWKRFLSGQSRPPKYQGRSRRKSFNLSREEFKKNKIHNRYIILPKELGRARLGDLPKWFHQCHLLGSTFSCIANQWYVSFTLKMPEELYYKHISNRKPEVGVDIGVAVYAALDNGEKYYSPESLKRLQARSEAIQRKISANDRHRVLTAVNQCDKCKMKGINGRQDQKLFCNDCRTQLRGQSAKMRKLQASLQRCKSRQAKIRNDMSHQLSTKLVKQYDKVVIEDLSVRNMTASAKGDAENPGSKVKQKAGLNKAILNVAPYKLRCQLEYKADRMVGTVIAVNPYNTSKECSECGHTSTDNRKNQSVFICQECGYSHNADVNAAKNILARSKETSDDKTKAE